MENIIYRIHNDSSHYVGIKYFKKYDSADKNSLKSYESEFTKETGYVGFTRGKEKPKDIVDLSIEKYYLESLSLKKKDRFNYINDKMNDEYGLNFEDRINVFLRKKEKSIYDRTDRFRKKALNNEWNYFVTITYDDKKHDENSFKAKLKKCLANLHTRNNYLYMGVFERSQSGRLHFHALFYIPIGEMKGEIREVKDYSTNDKKMRVANVNSFFEKRFGRNDFIKINSKLLMKDNTINYLLKYIEKSEEPIFYSRGIKTYHYISVSEEEIISTFGNIIKKYVFFDDILENYISIPMRC